MCDERSRENQKIMHTVVLQRLLFHFFITGAAVEAGIRGSCHHDGHAHGHRHEHEDYEGIWSEAATNVRSDQDREVYDEPKVALSSIKISSGHKLCVNAFRARDHKRLSHHMNSNTDECKTDVEYFFGSC